MRDVRTVRQRAAVLLCLLSFLKLYIRMLMHTE